MNRPARATEGVAPVKGAASASAITPPRRATILSHRFVHRPPAAIASFVSGEQFKVSELDALHIQIIDGHAEELAMADPGNQ